MKSEKRIPYEKADEAKSRLLELMDELMDDNAPHKEVEQLGTIIGKLEAWQIKYAD